MGLTGVAVTDSLAGCHACRFDLCETSSVPIISYDMQASDWLETLGVRLICWDTDKSVFDLNSLGVMHQLVMLLTSRYSTVRLHAHVCDRLGVPEVQMTSGRIAFETRTLFERHHLIQLVAWLMAELEPRLRVAWRAKAVRYNHLGKDFEDAPEWYLKVVEGFANWRHR